MRFVPIGSVKEGEKLGKNIYDSKGRILLKKGVTLNNKLLEKIKNNGIYSIYVDNDFDVEDLEDIIKPELRLQAINAVRNTFKNFQRFFQYFNNYNKNDFKLKEIKKENHEYITTLVKISEDIIKEIISNKNVLISLVDIKNMDTYTYQHCINVAVLSLVLGVELNLNKNELKSLCLGAILHDIGKIFIPPKILNKEDKLTEEEYEIVKTHTIKGFDYLKDYYDIPPTARIIALQHHEQVDGKGYPKGLKGDDIYKLSKIVAITDVYDALTSDRPFRKAFSPNEAIEYIMANGNIKFDYEFVRKFVQKIIPYPVGTLVKLSNGEIGIVKRINEDFILRPVIEIIKGNKRIVDLMKEKNLVIKGIQYENPL